MTEHCRAVLFYGAIVGYWIFAAVVVLLGAAGVIPLMLL